MILLQRTAIFRRTHLKPSYLLPCSPYRHFRLRLPSFPQVHRPQRRLWIYTGFALFFGGLAWAAYETFEPVRHTALATIRCSRVGSAAVLGAIDYKLTFARSYTSEGDEARARSDCHSRSAKRVLESLLANGGVFIKMGQHMASLIVLPVEWTSTMRPLQDQCQPTPYADIQQLFQTDMGVTIGDVFEEFDPEPIGVASLAQVHMAKHRESGKKVAVKVQHPHLAEFCDVDMKMVEVTLGWIKYWFPEFEFTWLSEEMRSNLPKELDFIHEAQNAARTRDEFSSVKTSLYIPQVLGATKRVLIMEYINGGRVDDLKYLADFNIDRNKVALELARVFNQMVFINGWFHADPHPGNILIRPSPPGSKSPYNFETVLLDHGLYFDIDTNLRINYSKLWLALISPGSPQTDLDRRKYAELVGNITPELYPVFEAAITGRAAMVGSWTDKEDDVYFKRASSVMDMSPQSDAEMEAIRDAVVNSEGVLLSVLDVLRRVPRRVLMVLKLNDLTRGLDHALMTTHPSVRIFLIAFKYCTYAVWQDERKRIVGEMRDNGIFSFGLLKQYFCCWWRYQTNYTRMVFLEIVMDLQAHAIVTRAWINGLWKRGLAGAHEAAAGLD